jgi:hypothetical protein
LVFKKVEKKLKQRVTRGQKEEARLEPYRNEENLHLRQQIVDAAENGSSELILTRLLAVVWRLGVNAPLSRLVLKIAEFGHKWN